MIGIDSTLARRAGLAIVVGAGVLSGAALTAGAERTLPGWLNHDPAPIVQLAESGIGPGTPDAATPTSAALSEPGSLQLVPAVRDVRVVVGGSIRSSDNLGRISLAGLAGPVDVEVLGYSATPSVQQVRFLGWSDGSIAPDRTIEASAAPVIEVEVQYRVVVAAPGLDPAAPVRLDSPTGPIELVPGEPTWVPALRPEVDGPIPYTLTSTAGNGLDDVSRPTYSPTPEALWLIES